MNNGTIHRESPEFKNIPTYLERNGRVSIFKTARPIIVPYKNLIVSVSFLILQAPFPSKEQ